MLDDVLLEEGGGGEAQFVRFNLGVFIISDSRNNTDGIVPIV